VNAGLFHLLASRGSDQGRALTAGVVIGVVTNNADPDGLSRVKVKFPWLSDQDESFWARIAAPMAGNNRGAYFLPEIDDEVLVAFEHGDVRFPYVIGALWNGKDKAPLSNSDGNNDIRVIKSRSGHVITLNDKAGQETIEIVDGSGNNGVVIDTANNRITITAGKDIVLSAPNGTIALSANTIDIEASGSGKLAVGTAMKVQAGAELALLGQPININ
jgi:uncharacterized protein involved in type VI secretion and phage assembly